MSSDDIVFLLFLAGSFVAIGAFGAALGLLDDWLADELEAGAAV